MNCDLEHVTVIILFWQTISRGLHFFIFGLGCGQCLPYAIARRYNTTVDAIKELNNLTSNTLSIGQILQIPSTNETTPTITYIVKAGDTLYAIARRYNTTVDAIKSLNNLTSNTLSIGQILQIPSTNETTPTITYTVQAGDTLYAIARRYNTTVDAIKSLNNLTSNTLSIGQILLI